MNRVAIVLDHYATALDHIDSVNVDNLLFELRLDKDFNLLSLLEKNILNPENVILTYRSEEEGGEGTGNREEIIQKLLLYKPKYIDIEVDRDNIPELPANTKLIISKHDYSAGMLECASIYDQSIKKTEGDYIYKFVGKPYDTLDAILAYKLLENKFLKYIILGVGKNAEITRTSLHQEFVFGASRSSNILSYTDLINLDNTSIRLGLLGRKIDYSLSPKIHSKFFDLSPLSGHYHLLEADNPKRAGKLIETIQDIGFSGINVTVPYKTYVMEALDIQRKSVLETNAVNTLIFQNGKIIGENTDTLGFQKFLQKNKLEKFETATVIGAGGAGRAVIHALLNLNFDVTLYNRSINRIKDMPEVLLNQIQLKDFSQNNNSSDLYIDATTLGNIGRSSAEYVKIGKSKVVIDLTYTSSPLRLEKNKSYSYFDGKQMLFYQALESFNLWTNTYYDYDYHKFQEVLL